MDRVDRQLHVEHHLFPLTSSSIATGSVVVAVVSGVMHVKWVKNNNYSGSAERRGCCDPLTHTVTF